MTARYLLCPGEVRSQTDGQRHHIGAHQLAFLYGVRMDECLIAHEPRNGNLPGRRTFEELMARVGTGELIALKPRSDGDYAIPARAPTLRTSAQRILAAIDAFRDQAGGMPAATGEFAELSAAGDELSTALALPDADLQLLSRELRTAMDIITVSRKVSVSEVQRKMAISYGKAHEICQSIVNTGLADGLPIGPSLDRIKNIKTTASKPAPADPSKRPENCGTSFCSCIECVALVGKYGGPELQALVLSKLAAPVEQKPLTNRQAYDAIAATVESPEPFDAAVTNDPSGWADAMQVVRAIEAAHNIRGAA